LNTGLVTPAQELALWAARSERRLISVANGHPGLMARLVTDKLAGRCNDRMAYNTLRPIKIDCPVCGTRSETDLLQFYAATKMVRLGDGKLVGFNYGWQSFEFGDKLQWLPREHPQYPQWREGLDRDYSDRDAAEEWLPVTCPDCRSNLLIVISIESLFIVGVLDIIQANDERAEG
jgi:hypothetical protein